MRLQFLIILLLASFLACNSERKENSVNADIETSAAIKFDKTKWLIKEGKDYPYRDQMLKDIVYNDTVRTLNKAEILVLLGEPDRINEGHLYYMIEQKRLGFWPLHTKTMVIKLTAENKVEWIKIHK